MPVYWGKDEDAILDRAIAEATSIDDIARRCSLALGAEVTKKSVAHRCEQRGIGTPAKLLQASMRTRAAALSEAAKAVVEEELPAVASVDVSPGQASEQKEAVTADRFYVERPAVSYEFKPLTLGPGELERIFLYPDVHRPFHDKLAWNTALRAAQSWKPHTVVILGDFVDCYSISDYDRDARRLHQLQDEIADANVGLDEIESLGAKRVIFIAGNHEDRLSRHLLRHSPALLNSISIPQLLRIQERGWTYVPYRQHAKVGKLYVTHDVGFSGVNAARSTGAAFGHSAAFGHTHLVSVFYWGSLTGERHVVANLGWLGDVEAASYAHEAKKTAWQHAFGAVDMFADGSFQLQAIPIVRGRCILGNRVITGVR